MSKPNHTEEQTFRSYTPSSSKLYAQLRRNYHPSVYESIINHHTATRGKLDHVLDVGCGPGLATATLATYFTSATGLDAGESMISVARSRNLQTSLGTPVKFEVSTAEAMEGIADESVDLITAANAAHWFDMPALWKRASQVLRPGGSVAMWTSGEPAAHPDTPNAAAINEAFARFERDHMRAYFERGNVLVRDGYRDIGMPWEVEPAIKGFDRESFWRKEWGLTEAFHERQDEAFSTEMFEKMWATSSPVTRWRQAHPGAEGTEDDVVRILRREIERLLAEAGVPEGEAVLKGASIGVMIMVKKVGGEIV